MRQSIKEKKVLHPVSRALQLEYRASLECADMLDEAKPHGVTPDRNPKQLELQPFRPPNW